MRSEPAARLEIPPCPGAESARLERELGVSPVLAQVLVRRGLAEPAEARAWLEADVRHGIGDWPGLRRAAGQLAGAARRRDRITVHGDYDCDGVCSTAVLVRALRALGADVDWYLPARAEGYGLSEATVARLATRGTRVLVCVDCAITAVGPVAAARAAGMEVLIADHHVPAADGRLPDAAIVHPVVNGYPCPDLCAAGVAHRLAGALYEAAGEDPARADEDLDIVALATVADVVALRGENRWLVRAGLRELARTAKPGLRALMRVARLEASEVDARAVGFRLSPRINAAGRLYRADAGLELLLCEDEGRAAEIAEELDRANVERRHTETRILFEAEAQVAAAGDAPAYVLAAPGWHRGVIGIVASRLAQRHHRPVVLVALPEADEGPEAAATGSGRSIPAFDLLAGLTACAGTLARYGGHRAAAGLEVAVADLEEFRAAFVAHAAATLSESDLVPTERVDAVAGGDELGLALAEELRRLEPFGAGNPEVSLLVAAAELEDPVSMGEGKHVRFTVRSGSARARAVAFGGGGALPAPARDGAVDATFSLELNHWQGAVEPRLVLRRAVACAPSPIACAEVDAEAPGSRYLEVALRELDGELDPWPGPVAPPGGAGRRLVDRRGSAVAGVIAAAVATGEGVLVVCADAHRRARHLRGRLGGFSLVSYDALAADAAPAVAAAHVVALDPPGHPDREELLRWGGKGGVTHLSWGDPELRFALHAHEHLHCLRAPLEAVYRSLRDGPEVDGPEALERVLRGEGSGRPARLAGRALRVLLELGLVELDRSELRLVLGAPRRTELDRSPAYRAYERRAREGSRFLSSAIARAA